jgi:hypothetical protein
MIINGWFSALRSRSFNPVFFLNIHHIMRICIYIFQSPVCKATPHLNGWFLFSERSLFRQIHKKKNGGLTLTFLPAYRGVNLFKPCPSICCHKVTTFVVIIHDSNMKKKQKIFNQYLYLLQFFYLNKKI